MVLTTKVVVGVTSRVETVAVVLTSVMVTGAAEVMVVPGAPGAVTVLVTVVVVSMAELETPNWVLYW